MISEVLPELLQLPPLVVDGFGGGCGGVLEH